MLGRDLLGIASIVLLRGLVGPWNMIRLIHFAVVLFLQQTDQSTVFFQQSGEMAPGNSFSTSVSRLSRNWYMPTGSRRALPTAIEPISSVMRARSNVALHTRAGATLIGIRLGIPQPICFHWRWLAHIGRGNGADLVRGRLRVRGIRIGSWGAINGCIESIRVWLYRAELRSCFRFILVVRGASILLNLLAARWRILDTRC